MSKGMILYVEDDLTLSFVTRDNLEMRGYSVDFCEDGFSALAKVTTQSYDICILDVMLPKMDGFMQFQLFFLLHGQQVKIKYLDCNRVEMIILPSHSVLKSSY